MRKLNVYRGFEPGRLEVENMPSYLEVDGLNHSKLSKIIFNGKLTLGEMETKINEIVSFFQN